MSDPAQRPMTRTDWMIAAALCVGVVTIFGQAGRFEFLNYDDDLYVTNNPYVLRGLSWEGIRWAFTGVGASNWHPITWLSHMLDVELFGLTPGGPHAVSMILHAVNGVLLFVVLRRCTGARWPAAACAALFAWHPLRAESVAWVSERKDVLSGLFFMLTLLAYERYARRPSAGGYGWVLTLFVLGLMSKPMLVTLPAVLLLLDFWPLGRLGAGTGKTIRALPMEKLPMAAISVASACVTIWAQQSARSVAGLESLPPGQRLANAVVAIERYVAQAFWPAGLGPFYPHPFLPPELGIGASQFGLALGLLAIVTASAVLLHRRAPWLAIGWGWHLVMLVPVIGIVQVGRQAHADRYTYLPTIGIGIAVCWSMAAAAPRGRVARHALAAAVAIVAGGLALLAHRQAGYWRDSITLWSRAINVTPENPVALTNLGVALGAVGRNDEAMSLYRRAVELDPESAQALRNLAVQHLARGEDTPARALLKRALEANPFLIEAYSNLAGTYVREGRLEDALLLYRQAVERDPASADGHFNVAATLAQLGRLPEAIESFEAVMRLRPDDASAAAAMHLARRMAATRPAEGPNNPATGPNDP